MLGRLGGSSRASTVVPLLEHAEHMSMLCSNMLVHNTSFQAIQGFRNPTFKGDGRPSGFVGEGFLGLEFPVCLFGIDSPLKTGGADTDEVTTQPPHRAPHHGIIARTPCKPTHELRQAFLLDRLDAVGRSVLEGQRNSGARVMENDGMRVGFGGCARWFVKRNYWKGWINSCNR